MQKESPTDEKWTSKAFEHTVSYNIFVEGAYFAVCFRRVSLWGQLNLEPIPDWSALRVLFEFSKKRPLSEMIILLEARHVKVKEWNW